MRLLSHVYLNLEESLVLDVDKYSAGDELGEKSVSRLIDLNESYEIIDFVRSTPYFGTYLGGYGGNNGSLGNFLNINPAGGSLLIRSGSDEDDAHVGVIVRYGKGGEILFDVEGCYL